MLRNEKYMGDALLQKTYTVDFMTKKKVINKGIVPQYYVEDDHEPIIPKELFYRVQEELARRAAMNKAAVTRKNRDIGRECFKQSSNGSHKQNHQRRWDFVGAFRQNVIRVIGSYGGEQEPDEYDEKIKEKEEEMVALIAENARVGSYTDEFDERYRRIAEEITTLKEEQIEARRKTKLADSYEQRLKDMDSFLEKQTCQIPEFDNDLVRRLIASIKVVSAEKLIIQFQSGIVMEQEIRYE
jgi:site-specific DNA recombinase